MNEPTWTKVEAHPKSVGRCPDKGIFADLEGVCLIKKHLPQQLLLLHADYD